MTLHFKKIYNNHTIIQLCKCVNQEKIYNNSKNIM